ncbi:hypothetical protein [Psychroflexus tropicus]|uniref:hypothetical protein n=1 Tax=Psychroflexus tropicus TaxID=197345 RepID=UPI00037AC076|nr:hypothetical protein [Psychroflexus tropicus]
MDKFKKEIQQKFSQREIQPTDEAWGKITGELASSRAKKTKSPWLWAGIAAGFIGLLVLLAPMYLLENTSLPVVNSKEKETPTIEAKRESLISVDQLQSKGILKSTVRFSSDNSIIEVPKTVIRSQPTSTQLKANSLLAEVEQELKNERYTQKNINEVDALLAQARANLSSAKDLQLFDQISAEQLLAEIDLEDTNSFRDKIWTLIETNFKELKTSLGAR